VTKVEPSGRDVSMMFQKPALLPHRDVLGNVAFPLEVHHELAAQIASRSRRRPEHCTSNPFFRETLPTLQR
jgi:ABC-type sugar transport system ATPase subunit